MKFSRFSLATLVALAALTPFASAVARAQKPALTENIDEKGRVPYHSSISIFCPHIGCSGLFKQVPAGYRLVVTYASVRYYGNPAPHTISNYVSLDGGAANPGEVVYQLDLPAPVSTGDNGEQSFYVVSSPVTYYVEPLGTPSLYVEGSAAGLNASGSISGYLVAVN